MLKLQQQSESAVNSVSTPESRKICNWNRQVAGCFQRSRAFVRMKVHPHGIVYGKIAPEHYVEDMVAEWFLSRFPLFTIIIESQRGSFVISRNTKLKIYREKTEDIIKKLEKVLPENPLLKDLENFNEDEYWEKYYDSQLITERKNRKYFLRNMPKKFLGWDALKSENNRFRKNRFLKEFVT